MGLLEDAIREHLELKRLRGADPAAVAREQREALEPPTGAQPAASIEDHAIAGDEPIDSAQQPAAEEAHAGGEPATEAPQGPNGGGLSHVAQETAELDMQAVLESLPATAAEHPDQSGSPAAPTPAGPDQASAEEDSLEWEVPARPSADAVAEPGPGDGHEGDGSHPTAAGEPSPRPGKEPQDGSSGPGAGS